MKKIILQMDGAIIVMDGTSGPSPGVMNWRVWPEVCGIW